MLVSAFRKATEDPILINAVGELIEVHVRNRKIVLDAPHLGRNHSEAATRPTALEEKRLDGLNQTLPRSVVVNELFVTP